MRSRTRAQQGVRRYSGIPRSGVRFPSRPADVLATPLGFSEIGLGRRPFETALEGRNITRRHSDE